MGSVMKKITACAICCVMIFTLAACGDKNESSDILTGNKWETASGMLLDLKKDGTFKWYNNKANRKDNYYSGKFTVRSGQEAIDFIEETQGFPAASQRSAMAEFKVSDDCYYSVVLNNKECIQNGKNTLEAENEIVYYGYYTPDYESLKLYNLNNLVPYDFTKM